MEDLLTDIANEALTEGKSIDFLLKGKIVILPKTEEVGQIRDYRPITLLEIPRKIITKAMTNRLKKVFQEDSKFLWIPQSFYQLEWM